MSAIGLKIKKVSVELQNSKLKKSGFNKFSGFSYFELSDFLPRLNELMLENGLYEVFKIGGTESFPLFEIEIHGEGGMVSHTLPFNQYATPLNQKGKPSMQDVQYLGALNTYYKRYLYMNAFGISDGCTVDSADISQGVGNKQKAAQWGHPQHGGNNAQQQNGTPYRNQHLQNIQEIANRTGKEYAKPAINWWRNFTELVAKIGADLNAVATHFGINEKSESEKIRAAYDTIIAKHFTNNENNSGTGGSV